MPSIQPQDFTGRLRTREEEKDNDSNGTVVDTTPKQLSKGVVLGKDGKPCRSCTSFASWASMTKAQSNAQTSPPTSAASTTAVSSLTPPAALPADCPPDVEALGRATWTLLHTLTATYPARATPPEQTRARTFIDLFSKMYPCSHCAEDFQGWMATAGNAPRLSGREEFGRWMCEAHNAVNVKLGKEVFDCGLWRERWRDGAADGRCG